MARGGSVDCRRVFDVVAVVVVIVDGDCAVSGDVVRCLPSKWHRIRVALAMGDAVVVVVVVPFLPFPN